MKIDLHKKEIRALMTCLSVTHCVVFSRKQKIILSKINEDKLYMKLSNILFECTFPGNLGPVISSKRFFKGGKNEK